MVPTLAFAELLPPKPPPRTPVFIAVAGETLSVPESVVTLFVVLVDDTARTERRGAPATAPAEPSSGVTSAAAALRELVGCLRVGAKV